MKTYPPGALIANRYEVASRPMMGGMGIVYICLDRQEDRPVALKTFKPEYLPDRAARDRFLREGTHWMDLGVHPHIVRCYRVFTVPVSEEVYLMLELVAKEKEREDASLRSWLMPGHPLPLETALLFALQIARGMQHAVDCIPGFVHRDLKPENVLVGVDSLPDWRINRLRVTDFGLAVVLELARQRIDESALSDDSSPTRDMPYSIRHTQLTHGIAGTPLYMAPEQWIGGPVGVYTDVYALGCILYEMLIGQTAAAGHSLEALQRAHCEGNLRPLSASLPEPVRDLVASCLALETEARCGGWEDVVEALVSAYEEIAGHPAPAVPTAVELTCTERVQLGWSYNAIGESYFNISKAEVAAGYFERARSVGSIKGEHELEGAALNNLGLAYMQLGDQRRAIGYYERALATHCETGSQYGKVCILNNLGVVYKNLGNAQRAIGYYEQALAICREIEYWHMEHNIVSNLGVAYKNLGDVQRAIGYHEQALEISREIGDQRGEGTILNNLGVVYKNLGNAQRAIKYYEQALEISREVGDWLGEVNALGNLGVAYNDLGDARRAIRYHEQKLIIDREIGYRRGEATALGNLGNAYAYLGNDQRAIRYYEQALTIDREIDNVDGVARHSFNIALMYTQLGNKSRALSLAYEAAHIWAQIGSPNAQRAQQLVAQLQGGGPVSSGPSLAQIVQQFTSVIEAVVAAENGHAQARAAVEELFPQLEQNGWMITDPVRRIWAGERNATALTAGLNDADALIVREILRQLAR